MNEIIARALITITRSVLEFKHGGVHPVAPAKYNPRDNEPPGQRTTSKIDRSLEDRGDGIADLVSTSGSRGVVDRKMK